jgi:hypothetical protein
VPHGIHLLGNLIPQPTGFLLALILLALSLVLIFAGRRMVKTVVFLIAGIAGAAVGAAAGAILLGVIGLVVGGIVGFVIAGLLGYLLLHLGIGIAMGYFAFEAVRSLTGSFIVSALAGIIFFIVGIILTNRVLEFVTAFIGGLIFYSVAVFFGLPTPIAAFASIVIAALGFFSQMRSKRKSVPSSVPRPQSV